MSLIWQEDAPKGKKFAPNPMPRIPVTGWKLDARMPDLSSAKFIGFDVETYDPNLKAKGSGWGRGDGHIVGVALSTDDGFKRYYPIRHEGFENVDPQAVLDYCSEQLSRPHQVKVGHNTLYDLGWLAHEGVDVVGDVFDTWTAEKLIEHSSEASLEGCAQRYLKDGKESSVLYDWAWDAFGRGRAKTPSERRKVAMQNIAQCPPSLVGFYAESDVDLPLRIMVKQRKVLEKLGLWDVFRMECDLQHILVQMRLAGVSVDLDAAERAYHQIDLSARAVQKEVDTIAGRPINTGSPVEMEKVFTKLKIHFNRTENGKMSLTGEFLKGIAHPIGQLIVDLEELKKYNSTFIQNAILNSNVNGKIHGEFNPLRAVTGRMSASNPNLQQVPSRNELSKVVRAIFIPDAGHDHWRKYDYSSIESRILAHYAVGKGSRELRREYTENPDTDYHSFTQKMIHDLVGLELNRKHVKNVNFAGIYGASENKLQRMMQLSDKEAATFFEAYHTGLPYVRGTMKAISSQAEEEGFTTTIMGRRALFNKWEPSFSKKGDRPFALPLEDAIRAYGPNIKRAYLHKALNYTIQGSAADLMKMAIVKCWKDGVYSEIGFPRLIVHDEKDFSVPTDWNEKAFSYMQHTMETALKFKIPVKVEGEWGPNWSNLFSLA